MVNNVLTATYVYLVNNGQLLGSKIESALFVKNASQPLKNAFVLDIPKTIPTGESIIFSIKNTDQFKKIKFTTFTFNTDGTKPVKFNLYKNGVSSATFATWGVNAYGLSSIAEVATDGSLALNTSSIQGISKIAEQIGGTILSKESDKRINTSSSDVEVSLQQNEILTITASTSNNSDIDVLVRWVEES